MSAHSGAEVREFEALVHEVARERWAGLSQAELLELAARQFVTGCFMTRIISEQKAEIARLHEQLDCVAPHS